MLNCEKTEEMMSDYIENSLSADKELDVTDHLSQCSKCSDTYNSLKNILLLLPDLQTEIPVHLENRLKLIQNIPPQKKPGNVMQLKWLTAIACSFVLLLNMFYFTNFSPRMNKLLHNLVFKIQKITVSTQSVYGNIKRNAVFSKSPYFAQLKVSKTTNRGEK